MTNKQKEQENITENKMKKSEGELLREYSRIISEADLPSGNWLPSDDRPDDEDMMTDDKQPLDNEDDNNFTDVDSEPEAEVTSDDPIDGLVSFIDSQDVHTDVPLADQIKKYLHTHNLELTPIGGLSNKQGYV